MPQLKRNTGQRQQPLVAIGLHRQGPVHAAHNSSSMVLRTAQPNHQQDPTTRVPGVQHVQTLLLAVVFLLHRGAAVLVHICCSWADSTTGSWSHRHRGMRGQAFLVLFELTEWGSSSAA
jgi:hypothetical protein